MTSLLPFNNNKKVKFTIKHNDQEYPIQEFDQDFAIIQEIDTDWQKNVALYKYYFNIKDKKHKPKGIKMVVKRITITHDKIQEIIKEIRTLYIADHGNFKHVIDLYGVCKLNLKEKPEILICMEPMDFSLADVYKWYIKKNNGLPFKFPEVFLTDIAGSIVDALIELHQHVPSVMHRDIKPTNILLNKQGYLKICDFGISKELTGNLTTDTHVGTLIYCAPERYTNQLYTAKVDVWSLGITLLEILYGKNPFIEMKNVYLELQRKLMNPNFTNELVEPLNGKYAPEIIDFISGCLAIDENKRPSSEQLTEYRLYKNSKRSANRKDNIKKHVKSVTREYGNFTNESTENTLENINQPEQSTDNPEPPLYPDLSNNRILTELQHLSKSQLKSDSYRRELLVKLERDIKEKGEKQTSLETKIDQLTNNLGNLEVDIESKNNEITNLNTEIKNKSEFRDKIDKCLEETIEKLGANTGFLKTAELSLDSVKIELDARISERKTLDNTIMSKTSDIAFLDGVIEKKKNERNQLISDNNNYNNDAGKLREECRQLENEKSALEQSIKFLEEEFANRSNEFN